MLWRKQRARPVLQTLSASAINAGADSVTLQARYCQAPTIK